ncbi:MAG: type II toxin-antitoxin system prevent-host-death family antitoxin [Acholeplasmatales bacterium]|nr:type II toxin-antitoxin system prevent-host-death family antitoxin [Acholeplasmatales bacterium]
MKKIQIDDLQDTNKISNLCNVTNEPIIITKNGYDDLVIMSIKTYEEKLERIEMHEAILEGLSNVDNGKIIDVPTALHEFKYRH